jgi:hypothetical protein
LAGSLAGVVLGAGGGAALAGYVLLEHPHFASRLRAQLSHPAPVPTIPPGSLGDVVVTVDLTTNAHPISPYIYGVAGADPATLVALGATVDRWGGNSASQFNWAAGHYWNAARDWEFRNGNYGRSGAYADQFVSTVLSAGATPLMTVPSIGFVAKNDNNLTRSVGVPAQGGPSIAPGSQAIAGYDPTANRQATSVPSFARKPGPLTLTPDPHSAAVYQDEWVHELTQKFGAGPTGVSYFAIDNEPDLWSVTHTDVHPVRMGYDAMLANYVDYAAAVKAVDPKALVLGPDVSGWTSYFYSELDRGNDNFATHADRNAHGGTPFLQWWLGQVAAADRLHGQRSLDLLDVHYYPQAQGVFSEAHDPATQALRIRSVRSLYDPTYSDESWIGSQVDLIPRLKQWIASEYPGTGIAISEYNWGGEKDASGAVALAEVLGVYGRQGVDVATYWTYPPPNSPAGAAFRLYRNFDGKGATFGDVSLAARSSKPGVAVFAARQSNRQEVDVVLVNESPDQVASVRLNPGLKGKLTTTTFQVVEGTSTITQTPVASLAGSLKLSPYSVNLVRVVQG